MSFDSDGYIVQKISLWRLFIEIFHQKYIFVRIFVRNIEWLNHIERIVGQPLDILAFLGRRRNKLEHLKKINQLTV